MGCAFALKIIVGCSAGFNTETEFVAILTLSLAPSLQEAKYVNVPAIAGVTGKGLLLPMEAPPLETLYQVTTAGKTQEAVKLNGEPKHIAGDHSRSTRRYAAPALTRIPRGA